MQIFFDIKVGDPYDKHSALKVNILTNTWWTGR